MRIDGGLRVEGLRFTVYDLGLLTWDWHRWVESQGTRVKGFEFWELTSPQAIAGTGTAPTAHNAATACWPSPPPSVHGSESASNMPLIVTNRMPPADGITPLAEHLAQRCAPAAPPSLSQIQVRPLSPASPPRGRTAYPCGGGPDLLNSLEASAAALPHPLASSHSDLIPGSRRLIPRGVEAQWARVQGTGYELGAQILGSRA